MTRGRLFAGLAALAIVAFVAWIAANTDWVDYKVPMPPRGEAARNPFYGAQRFAEALGARTSWDRTLVLPPTTGVLVLSRWNWNLSTPRRQQIERWVADGGRLLVDDSVLGDPAFEAWSGIEPATITTSQEAREARASGVTVSDEGCEAVREEAGVGRRLRTTYQLCGGFRRRLDMATTPTWTLRGPAESARAARVTIGRGSVTAMTASIVRQRELLDGDHGFIFVQAAQLRRGDEIHFLSETDYPSILALIWREGAAIVALALAALGLALWRGGLRFGPLTAPSALARRSLAEQILGTGEFAWRRGDTAAFFTATVRALDEAARTRIAGYVRLTGRERAEAIARLSDTHAVAIDRALHDPAQRAPERVRNTLALLEAARRRLLTSRSSNGTK